MGWRVRGRFGRERIWVYLWLIHVVVCQKPTVVKQFSSSFFKKILSLYWDLKGRNRDSHISRSSEYF